MMVIRVQLHSFACGYQFSQHYLLKRLFLYMRDYFWTVYFILLVYMSLSKPVPHCFDYCSFTVSLEIRKYETSNFVVLFCDCFGYSGSLEIPCEF